MFIGQSDGIKPPLQSFIAIFKEPTMAFILLLLWIGASIVIGKLAQASGRSFFIWFVISMLIDPIFGAILFAVVVRSK
jgi:uncharacterized membrane protein YhdT